MLDFLTPQDGKSDRTYAIEALSSIDAQIRNLNLQTITSISGGKPSAYMALHYPTDLYVFACVLT